MKRIQLADQIADCRSMEFSQMYHFLSAEDSFFCSELKAPKIMVAKQQVSGGKEFQDR